MSPSIAIVLAVSALPGPDRPAPDPPAVSIRIEHPAPYLPGDTVRAFIRVSAGVYLTVLRVDTEGRIRVLYPATPAAGGFVSARTSRTFPTGRLAPFRSGPRPGVGYVAAFVSAKPFDYGTIVREGRWDHSPTARGRIVGDPVAGLLQFMAPLAESVSYDVEPYRVGGDYPYPRFACTGCHAATATWDPYAGRCRYVTLEEIVAWYPARAAGPQRAVAHPVRPLPLLRYRSVGEAGSSPLVPHSGLRRILEPWSTPKTDGRGGLRTAPRSTGKPELRRRRRPPPPDPSGETRRRP